MASNYRKLGEFLRLTDERNSDLSITNLQGVSINKQFIPSIANIIGTDLSSYKIVRKGQFAYGPVTSRNGDKISIALQNAEDCIVSSSYLSFEIINKKELDPGYLMLWFMRPEFDRYARFMSHGSAREIFDWECMCNVELPVPSIEKQLKIVHGYRVITNRIELLKKINVNLDKILINTFLALDKSDERTIKDLTKRTMGIKTGKSPKDISAKKTSEYLYPIIGASGLMGYTSDFLCDGRVISTGRVGTIGKVMLWEHRNWFTDNSLMIETEYIATLYALLKTFNFAEITGGSSNPKITQSDLNDSCVLMPRQEQIAKYEAFAKPIINLIFMNRTKIDFLERLSWMMLSTISKEVP